MGFNINNYRNIKLPNKVKIDSNKEQGQQSSAQNNKNEEKQENLNIEIQKFKIDGYDLQAKQIEAMLHSNIDRVIKKRIKKEKITTVKTNENIMSGRNISSNQKFDEFWLRYQDMLEKMFGKDSEELKDIKSFIEENFNKFLIDDEYDDAESYIGSYIRMADNLDGSKEYKLTYIKAWMKDYDSSIGEMTPEESAALKGIDLAEILEDLDKLLTTKYIMPEYKETLQTSSHIAGNYSLSEVLTLLESLDYYSDHYGSHYAYAEVGNYQSKFKESLEDVAKAAYKDISKNGTEAFNYEDFIKLFIEKLGTDLSTPTSILDNMSYEEFLTELESDEFNKEVNKNEAKQYADDFCKAIKEYLINKKHYSKEYTDVIIEFIQKKTSSLLENSSSQNINLKFVLSEINKIENNISDKTSLEGENYKKNICINKLDTVLKEEYTNKSIQNEFFAFLLNNTYSKFNENDSHTFMRKIMNDVLDKLGMEKVIGLDPDTLHEYDLMFNIADFIQLDSDNDGSWLNEFYEIINANFAILNKTKNYPDAEQINVDSLFGDKEALAPQDISAMLDDMMFSEDEGIVKLRAMFYQAFDKFHIDNYYDETELITDIIKMFNDIIGASNEKPVKFTKESFNALNDGTIFEKFEAIINDEALSDEYYYGVDDELDLYAEGRTSGACWAIAALTSLSMTEKGKQIIKDAMTFNEDGSVTVTFKGADNRSYTITQDDIKAAKQMQHNTLNGEKYLGSDGLIYGDNTALVLLLALERLRKEMGNYPKTGNPIAGELGQYVYSGNATQMIKWICGDSSVRTLGGGIALDEYYDEESINYLKSLENNSFYDVVQEYMRSQIDKEYDKKDIFQMYLPGIQSGDVVLNLTANNHALAVKNVTEDTITYWDLYAQTEYTISLDEALKKFSITFSIIGDFKIDLPKVRLELPPQMSLEEYDTKLQGDEFNYELDAEDFETQFHIQAYIHLLDEALESIYGYDEDLYDEISDSRDKLLNKFLNNLEGNINLKDTLNHIKSIYNPFIAEPTLEDFETLLQDNTLNTKVTKTSYLFELLMPKYIALLNEVLTSECENDGKSDEYHNFVNWFKDEFMKNFTNNIKGTFNLKDMLNAIKDMYNKVINSDNDLRSKYQNTTLEEFETMLEGDEFDYETSANGLEADLCIQAFVDSINDNLLSEYGDTIVQYIQLFNKQVNDYIGSLKGSINLKDTLNHIKMLCSVYTCTGMTYEEYDTALQGDIFDSNTNNRNAEAMFRISDYVNLLNELLISECENDGKSDEYHNFVNWFKDEFMKDFINNIKGTFNLKDMLNAIKDMYNEVINSDNDLRSKYQNTTLEEFETMLEGDEFNYEISADNLETMITIESFTNLLNDMLSEFLSGKDEGYCNYTKYFITHYVIDIIQDMKGKNINLKDTLNEIKNVYYDIVHSDTNTDFEYMFQLRDCYSKGNLGMFIYRMMEECYRSIGNSDTIYIKFMDFIQQNYRLRPEMDILYLDKLFGNSDGDWTYEFYMILKNLAAQ